MSNFCDDVSSSTSTNDECSSSKVNKSDDNMLSIEHSAFKTTNSSFFNPFSSNSYPHSMSPITPIIATKDSKTAQFVFSNGIDHNITSEPPNKKRKLSTIWPQPKREKKEKETKVKRTENKSNQSTDECMFSLIIAPKMIKSSLSLMITPQTTNDYKPSIVRPIIHRTECFGDYFFKRQRSLNVYAKFCSLQSGKLFETENVIKGCFGIDKSEMVKHETFSNRILPLIFDQDLFVNLPEDLLIFVNNLFDLIVNEKLKCSQISKMCAKFAKYHFNLIHLCYAMSADYEYRQNDNEINENFDGIRWVAMVYKLKNECIENGHSQLFEPFDPSSNALFGCLWNENEPITFFEVELKLNSNIYGTNESVLNDVNIAFSHLERIFAQNESIRTFVEEKLKKIWFDGITINDANVCDERECDDLANEFDQVFETRRECILYFESAKNKMQKKEGGKLKIEQIIKECVIETKFEGNVCFYCVQYCEFPNEYFWECRLFMIRFYRNEIKKYVANKKKKR